jgi:ribosomal 50S subunit-recycling heat shock protein
VGGVDAKENTIALSTRGDNGVVERVYPLAPNAKITVDGKDAKLADVPKNATAAGLASAVKEGQLPHITELRVTGDVANGTLAKVDATSVTLDAGGKEAPRAVTAKITADTRVTVNGKPAKPADLKAGDKATVTLTSNGASALAITAGTKVGDSEKPREKPEGRPEARAFAGKIVAVDAATRTVTLASKGEGGRELQVKLTADAKVVIDGKPAKLDDLKKGALASFTIVAAKDGQPREASAVTVTGPTFTGVVKQTDATTITVGNEKTDRVFKLAPGGKVMLGAKEGKFADVKAGDRVSVTLASDDTGAVLIVVGAKREGGDKPKGDKEERDE